jgi:hypothetical protein
MKHPVSMTCFQRSKVVRSVPIPVNPTTDNIIKVKKNIKNLQCFNDKLYTLAVTKCTNAFVLLNESDNKDFGLNNGINLLCSGLLGICNEFGITGAVAANLICGIVGQYSESKPAFLTQSFTSVINRLQATFTQLDNDLEALLDDPVQNWSKIYTGMFNISSGTHTPSSTLGNLATIDFPSENDELFDDMMKKAIFSFDQTIWWVLLNQHYQVNGNNNGLLLPSIIQASKLDSDDSNNTGMINYCKKYITENPTHWVYWVYYRNVTKKGKDNSYYVLYDYNLALQSPNNTNNTISKEAAEYLFIDSIDDCIINPNGLFNRHFVFNDFDLVWNEQKSLS